MPPPKKPQRRSFFMPPPATPEEKGASSEQKIAESVYDILRKHIAYAAATRAEIRSLRNELHKFSEDIMKISELSSSVDRLISAANNIKNQPAPTPTEHPATRAARIIRQMHVDTIAKIDGGFTFRKKLDDGELVNCNDEIRAVCVEQLKLCDAILENVDRMASMPAELLRPIEIMLQDAQEHVAKALDKAEAEGADDALPEIGNYDHKAD